MPQGKIGEVVELRTDGRVPIKATAREPIKQAGIRINDFRLPRTISIAKCSRSIHPSQKLTWRQARLRSGITSATDLRCAHQMIWKNWFSGSLEALSDRDRSRLYKSTRPLRPRMSFIK